MKLTKVSLIAAIGLESVGACVGLGGIIVEYITKADIGYCLITGGAVLVTLGGMIFAKLIKIGKGTF